MDTQEILFQKTPVDTTTPVTPATFVTPTNDIARITIFDNLPKTCKRPVKITPNPKFVPLRITMSGPVPYRSKKTIPWNYGGEIFYHGIKQIESVQDNSDDETLDIGNIEGMSKITHSGRIFSLEIAPPRAFFGPSRVSVPVKSFVQSLIIEEIDVPEARPSDDTSNKGKGILEAHVRMKAQTVVIPETSKKEMDEILRIIKISDYDVVEQLG